MHQKIHDSFNSEIDSVKDPFVSLQETFAAIGVYDALRMFWGSRILASLGRDEFAGVAV